MSVLRQLSQDLRALVQRVSPAVVGLEHRRGQGSGMVLASDGYLLTNAHVARGGPPCSCGSGTARRCAAPWWG